MIFLNKYKFNRHLQFQCFRVNLLMDQLMILLRLILLIFLEESMNHNPINKNLGFKLFRFIVMMIFFKIKKVLIMKMILKLIFNKEIELFPIWSPKKNQRAIKKLISKKLSLNTCLHNLEIRELIFLGKSVHINKNFQLQLALKETLFLQRRIPPF